jgi:hypothetical protein
MNMQRIIKTLVCVISAFLMSATFSNIPVYAYDAPIPANSATLTLASGILIGDSDGISVDKQGYYYIDARALKPGDVIKKTLTIQNAGYNDRSAEGRTPFTLGMTAEPMSSQGPVDLLDRVSLTLVLDGKTIYQGPVRGNGTPNMIEKTLNLGIYEVGTRRVLEITMIVDPTMTLYKQKSEADFKWHFYGWKESGEAPPKTGILKTYGHLFPVGFVLMLFTILIAKKKRREREHLKAGQMEYVDSKQGERK